MQLGSKKKNHFPGNAQTQIYLLVNILYPIEMTQTEYHGLSVFLLEYSLPANILYTVM